MRSDKRTYTYRLVHAIITKRGQAMHTLLNRLTPIMDLNCSEWNEPQYLKQAGFAIKLSQKIDVADPGIAHDCL